MSGIGSNVTAPPHYRNMPPRPRSENKRSRIVYAAMRHFAEHGYHASRVGDIADELGIAKGSIFQHFGSKDGLFFEALLYWLASTEHLIGEDWIPYRVSLLGNYGTDLALKREINRFLLAEDPYGTVAFVKFGQQRKELRADMDQEMIVSFLD